MKYMEIRDLIGQELKSYAPNQLIPSERYLALKYQCSRETIRKAYEQLRAEDKIYKVHNVGWFVSNKKIQYYPASIENFNSYLKAQGFNAKTELISAQQVDVFAGSDLFDAAIGAQGFYEIIRLRYADNVPVLLEYNYLPVALFPGFINYEIIPSVEEVVKNQFNVKYSSSRLKIKNTAADEFDGKQLGIPSSQTAIRIERISKSDNQVIEFDIEIWPEDKIEMNMEIYA
ncbi:MULTISPECIES: GntR family transcriptional regulator [Acinetobacter]|jgi:GntR family transcriptional regulator|uniref:GntR family transcriptional regulator n=2 Tax=Acinetobacter TaxID=469 RepID=A0A4Q7ANS4_9GAMM|nr:MULTISPECIES: GntR family transcriptional regulator [Acinetobacter]MCW8040728.1 GntR family transcriptional regulator [Acinetobacter entericus]RZG64440.1 GntR family transcriptional regulator [Acinetobacter bouvetii]TCB72186.1 GntR family transcriptional regulator [Acinetobacter sp. ANC 4177]